MQETGKKIVIYGAGWLGKEILKWLPNNYDFLAQIVAFVDSYDNNKKIYGIPVYLPEKLLEIEYDYILIGSCSEKSVREIKEKLYEMGINNDQIITGLEGIGWHIVQAARYEWIKQFSKWIEDNNIPGNVAECGVFRGDCAKFINDYFYNRKLYLFDTFEGFERSDLEKEKEIGNVEFLNGQFNTDSGLFDNTSVARVMEKMTYPSNVIIKKGWFPQSAEGIEDTFCFVNLDTDLYQPILSGLEFFWDKIEIGGCILVHDYFHPMLPGVKKAVEDFEKMKDVKLQKMPIGDGCSIAILK